MAGPLDGEVAVIMQCIIAFFMYPWWICCAKPVSEVIWGKMLHIVWLFDRDLIYLDLIQPPHVILPVFGLIVVTHML